MNVTAVPIERVIPYARNPRRNDAAVAKVAASINEFGWRQPIVVDRGMVVIAGHTRLMAARLLGMTEVPVHVADGLTPAQVKAYRLADNRVAQEAAWDEALLGLELHDISDAGFNVDLTGFDHDEVEDLLALAASEYPDLPTGDRVDVQEMSFLLQDAQAAVVRAAVVRAREAGPFGDTRNANVNGNALARICEAYLRGADANG